MLATVHVHCYHQPGCRHIRSRERKAAMSAQRPGYVAYLLRLWQAQDVEGLCWRASLQDVRSGERQGFASLEALFEFLRAQTEGASDHNPEDRRE